MLFISFSCPNVLVKISNTSSCYRSAGEGSSVAAAVAQIRSLAWEFACCRHSKKKEGGKKRLPIVCWMEVVRVGIFVFAPDLRKKAFTVEKMLAGAFYLAVWCWGSSLLFRVGWVFLSCRGIQFCLFFLHQLTRSYFSFVLLTCVLVALTVATASWWEWILGPHTVTAEPSLPSVVASNFRSSEVCSCLFIILMSSWWILSL